MLYGYRQFPFLHKTDDIHEGIARDVEKKSYTSNLDEKRNILLVQGKEN